MTERTVLGNHILLNKSIGRGAFSKFMLVIPCSLTKMLPSNVSKF